MAYTLAHQAVTETLTFKAGAAITRYRAVKLHTTEGEVIMSTDGDAPIGVALETVSSGENIRVCTAGICPVYAEAAIALNAVVHPSGDDGVVDDDASDGEFALGWALRAATAAGDEIPVRINVHQVAA